MFKIRKSVFKTAHYCFAFKRLSARQREHSDAFRCVIFISFVYIVVSLIFIFSIILTIYRGPDESG